MKDNGRLLGRICMYVCDVGGAVQLASKPTLPSHLSLQPKAALLAPDGSLLALLNSLTVCNPSVELHLPILTPAPPTGRQ